MFQANCSILQMLCLEHQHLAIMRIPQVYKMRQKHLLQHGFKFPCKIRFYLVEFWKAQTSDQTLSKVINFCQTKWPDELAVSAALKPYWKIRDELSVCKQLLLRGDRIVIPSCLQEDILQHLNQGHQGIVKCKLCARSSVCWPGILTQIDKVIRKFQTYSQNLPSRSEPLIPKTTMGKSWL